MSVTQAFRMAVRAVFANKIRSFLTMLGVIIGVLSVTLLITLGQGGQQAINDEMGSLGTNLLAVFIAGNAKFDVPVEDIYALRGRDGIKYVSPSVTGTATVRAAGNDYETSVEGVAPDYSGLRSVSCTSGRFIDELDLEGRFYVALIGTTVAEELFSRTNVVGERILMLGREFEIVGVLEEKGSSGLTDDDDRILIPITTAQRIFKLRTSRLYYFGTETTDQVESAQIMLEQFFGQRMRDPEDMRVINQNQIMDVVNQSLGILTSMLAGIAAISLLVGGIGIMNIMLVSVTERTREIGIRKAIGAKRLDVLMQFLIEAGMISTLGGLVGLGLGVLGASALTVILGMNFTVSGDIGLMAILFSLAVGVIFGLSPANKASKLRPIEALRHE